jgi:hypothetical protein
MNINIQNLDSTIEHWASIDGYLNYQVSWWGRVVNTKTGRILKAGRSSNSYLTVILCKEGKRTAYSVHVLVAREWVPNPDNKRCVDHADGDRFNNHHENLRYATQSENCRNRKKQVDSSSAYKGVCFDKKSRKWIAQIYMPGKHIHLGTFGIEREAGEAYNATALEHFGEFAKLNKFDD